MAHDYLACVAIDIGTAYSGYAFQLVEDSKKDLTSHIYGPTWCHADMGRLSMKTITAVLLNPDQTFRAFGFEAESQYTDPRLHCDGYPQYKPIDFLFFKDFKMELYRCKRLNRRLTIAAHNGRKVSARKVMTETIRFLKDHALIELNTSSGIREGDVYWVLTVPAIWSESAKIFMRESAEDAGIDSNALTLALEPEVAAIHCIHTAKLRTQINETVQMKLLKEGMEFLVLDLGGGTGDITVHRVHGDNSLHEIHKATGDEMGGGKVDQEFLKIWEFVLGKVDYDAIYRSNPDEILDLRTRFEIAKRQPDLNCTSVKVYLPPCISRFPQIMTKVMLMFQDEIQLYKDKAIIKNARFRQLFSSTIVKILAHLGDLFELDHIKSVKTVLMVGGFSESNLVYNAIKEHFPEKQVFRPSECSLAVLKGAVMYGVRQISTETRIGRFIGSRISRYTYGISTRVPYDNTKHTTTRDLAHRQGDFIEDVFKEIYKVGTRLTPGESTYKIRCRPSKISVSDNKTRIDFYATMKENPQYTAEAGLDESDNEKSYEIGAVEVDLTGVTHPMASEIELTIVSGYTQLQVQAIVVETKRTVKAAFRLKD